MVWYRFQYFLYTRLQKHRLLLSFLSVFCAVSFSLWGLSRFIGILESSYNFNLIRKAELLIEFAPEVWLGQLALVLGTLIIIISIASQSIPKLIDLYTNDWISLFYVWFIVISFSINVFLQIFAKRLTDGGTQEDIYTLALIDNFIFLPIAILLTLPYIFYILKYTKTSNVIEKIYNNNMLLIHGLKKKRTYYSMFDMKIVEDYQIQMFQLINQLSDLLEYLLFKDNKGDIINIIGLMLIEYIKIKDGIHKNFFRITERIYSDISFRTMVGQFEDIEESIALYEQKCFRTLGNAYVRFLHNTDYELASVTVSQLTVVGRYAVLKDDNSLVQLILVRFNTTFRFAIKYGIRKDEARNIYNAVYHYSDFIKVLIDAGRLDDVKRACRYLSLYGSEIFRHSRKHASLKMLVNVFSWDFSHLLMRIRRISEYSLSTEEELLIIMLNIIEDYQPEKDTGFNIEQVRIVHISLALFYLVEGNDYFVNVILTDMRRDSQSTEDFLTAVNCCCENIRRTDRKFWEDTDRGTESFFYSEHQGNVPRLLELAQLIE